MALWPEESESISPFKEEDDTLRDDLAPELAQFLSTIDINRAFTLEIKRYSTETYGGTPQIVEQFQGRIPTYESLVCMNGPGYYSYDFSFLVPGKKKRNTETVKIPLIGERWRRMFEAKRRERLEEDRAESQRYNGGNLPAQIDQGGMLTGIASLMKAVQPPPLAAPSNDMATVISAFATMMQGMSNMQMQMMMAMQKNSTDMIIALTGNQTKKESSIAEFKEIFSMAREMSGLETVSPKEESLLERVIGGVVDNLDLVKDFLRETPPREVPTSYVGKKISKQPEMMEARQRVAANPAFLAALVKHLDATLGDTGLTDRALSGFLNIKRPDAPQSQEAEEEVESAEGEGEAEG